jgi:hypothetical protein
MTTDQKIRLNMLLGVRNYGNQNEQVTKSILKFGSGFETMKNTIGALRGQFFI